MEAVTIRLLASADVPAISGLLEILARRFITVEFSQAAEDAFFRLNNVDAIEGFIQSGFTYHVAEAQGRIVGFIGMRENSHLHHLFVSEEMQGKKLARALWNAAREACQAAGNPGCFTVNSSNNAVPVYESFGFVRTQPTQNMNGVLYNPMAIMGAVPT